MLKEKRVVRHKEPEKGQSRTAPHGAKRCQLRVLSGSFPSGSRFTRKDKSRVSAEG